MKTSKFAFEIYWPLNWLFLQLGPSKAVKIFQILNLIKKSVSIFGNKMDMGQNQEVILASHGDRQINPCLQGLILVKFARLTLPLNPSSSNTWIKRLVPFAQSIFLNSCGGLFFMKTEDFALIEIAHCRTYKQWLCPLYKSWNNFPKSYACIPFSSFPSFFQI